VLFVAASGRFWLYLGTAFLLILHPRPINQEKMAAPENKTEPPLGNPVIFSSLKEIRGYSPPPHGKFNLSSDI
jgi:hypothetical protein